MSNFCSDQGRTRVCGPRKAGQEGVRLYAAAGNPRPPARRAYASERERRAEQKGPFMDGHYNLPFLNIAIRSQIPMMAAVENNTIPIRDIP
jgi:hypothetical protein